MGFNTKPRVLFSNPPWWVSAEPCVLNAAEQSGGLHTAGVRAGSRWPFTYEGRSIPGYRDLLDYMPYPFFMGYATTYVQQKTGANVRLRDSIALRETYDSYFLYLLQNRFDVIFIESASPSWEHDRALIGRIRQMLPETVTVVTGPIATRGAVVLEESGADAAIKGEYEKGAVRAIDGARGVLDFDLLTTDEMNAAPFPYFDSLIWDKYWDANPRGQQAPQLQAWTSRGCPYKCIFCVWPAAMTGNDPDGSGKRAVRHYTPDYMEHFLVETVCRFLPGGPHPKRPFESVYFDDDTFNLGNSHVLGVCAVMGRLGLPWSAMCRADTSKRETWREMRDSGCFGVKIGFESGNQHVVDQIVNKRLDLEKAKDTVSYLHSIGMTVHGTFTYGLPGETREQMQDTKRYIQDLLKLGMDTYQESGCAEIEGAPLRTLAEKGNLVAFPAARTDSSYRAMSNGSEKLRQITASVTARGGMVRGRVNVEKYQDPGIEGWMSQGELQWLYETAKTMGNIAEIGSFKGRSTHALASGCSGTVTCVDHFNPEYLRPVENDHVYRAFCENITKNFGNVFVLRRESVEAAKTVPDGFFDMVFIDAHHTYESIAADIEAWAPKTRLLLCGHDYTPGWPGVIQAVEEKLQPGVEFCESIWFKRLNVPKESSGPKAVTAESCPKCESPDVYKLRESIQHVIVSGAAEHRIQDEIVCRSCDSVWLVNQQTSAVSAPEKSLQVALGSETPSPATDQQKSGTALSTVETQDCSTTEVL